MGLRMSFLDSEGKPLRCDLEKARIKVEQVWRISPSARLYSAVVPVSVNEVSCEITYGKRTFFTFPGSRVEPAVLPNDEAANEISFVDAPGSPQNRSSSAVIGFASGSLYRLDLTGRPADRFRRLNPAGYKFSGAYGYDGNVAMMTVLPEAEFSRAKRFQATPFDLKFAYEAATILLNEATGSIRFVELGFTPMRFVLAHDGTWYAGVHSLPTAGFLPPGFKNDLVSIIDPRTGDVTPQEVATRDQPYGRILPDVFDLTGRHEHGDWIIGGLSATAVNLRTLDFRSTLNPSIAVNDFGGLRNGVRLSEYRDGFVFTMQENGQLFSRMSMDDYSYAYYDLNISHPFGNLWLDMQQRRIAIFTKRAYVYGKMPSGSVHVFEFDLEGGGYNGGRITDLGVLENEGAAFQDFVRIP